MPPTRSLAPIALTLACAALLLWVALIRPTPQMIDVGGALRPRPEDATIRDAYVFDTPYLDGFHGPEPAQIEPATPRTYRWSFPTATLRTPVLAGASAAVALRLAPPPAPTTPLTVTLNGAQTTLALPPEPRTLILFAPAAPDGALTLDLATTLYAAADDPRELGVTLDRVTITPIGWRLAPAWPVWAALTSIIALLALGALLAGLMTRATIGLLTLATATLLFGLVLTRDMVTLAATRWLIATLWAVLALASARAAARLARLPAYLRRELAWIAGLTALGWLIRLAGVRHPQANHSDLLLNVNNLVATLQGELIFTEGLPAEAGGGRQPYPPGWYLILIPLTTLANDGPALGALIQSMGALLDALVIALIWWMVRTFDGSALGQRRALWAAALYLFPLPLLRSQIVGEYANVGGQALALIALAGLVVWMGRERPPHWRFPVALALACAVLMHSGVVLSLGMVGALWALMLASQRRWAAARSLVFVGALGCTLALVIYYTAFLGADLARKEPLPPDVAAFIAQPATTKAALLIKAKVLIPNADTPWWLWLAALPGLAICRRRTPELFTPLAAWLLSAPLALTMLLWSGETVRWWAWVYPALCIGAGFALTSLATWSALGRRLAITALLAFSLTNLGLWVFFIATYRTGVFVP